MKYTKEKPLRVFTAFSGYDSQCLALNRLRDNYPDFDYVCVGWSEIDETAIKAHDALFPQDKNKNYGDISKIDWSEVPDFDLFTYSFPCFVAGTLVLTNNGFRPIEEIKEGDMVLTHRNRFRRVTSVGKRNYEGAMVALQGMSTNTIYCTEEHPFFVRKMYRKGHNSERCFYDPEWVKAKDIDKKTYLGYAINQEAKFPEWNGVTDNRYGHGRNVNKLTPLFRNTNFWYIMGRYVGDGWKKINSTGNGVVICCSQRNKKTLIDALNEINWHFTV